MWFCKKRENPNTREMSTVVFVRTCTDCGCLVAQDRGKKVSDRRTWGDTLLLYCDGCYPPYDEVYVDSLGAVSFHKKVPEHMVEVTEKGKPIKA